tara:strand:+ start:175 stop:648 length:474 start_codon:yes stop_codon:yes gene_type:complete
VRRNLSRIKNFFSLLETVFNSRRLRTILGALIFFVCVFGYVFYITEPGVDTFGDGIWWALVTVTTVGYGDITPSTTLGRFVASALMFLGLGLIATVTAIVSAKFTQNFVDTHTNDDVLAKLEELESEIEKLKELEEDELEKLDDLDSEIQDIKDKFQ